MAVDTLPTPSDYVLAKLAPVALGPGAWTGDSLTFRLPSDFAEGTYELVLQLDATNLMPGSDIA